MRVLPNDVQLQEEIIALNNCCVVVALQLDEILLHREELQLNLVSLMPHRSGVRHVLLHNRNSNHVEVVQFQLESLHGGDVFLELPW